MEIKVLEREGKRTVLLLEGIPVVVANSIRRVAIAEVPTMAIEHVFVHKNTSVMDDEILAHRLALIPLKTDLTKYVPCDEAGCESEFGCPECSTSLYLEAKAEDSEKVVYSGDLVSEDGITIPVSPDIPIVKLAPRQEVSLEARAVMGRGKDHAKWQPVSVAVARGVPRVKLSEGLEPSTYRKLLELCPRGVFSEEEGRLIAKAEYKCTLCDLCRRDLPGSVEIEVDETSSILELESVGQLEPEEIVLRSIDILIRKLREFGEEVRA